MQGWRRNKGIKGHDRMKLGELGTFKTGGTPSRSKNEYWGDKYPWISSTALGDVYIDENAATDWISDEGLKNSSTKLIKANSLMIGIRIGVGKCSINRIPMCTSQDVVSIEGIDTERYYLPYITTLINNKRHYLESLKRGATIQGITTDIIKNLQIPDIQINRQKLIADTIQVVDDMVCLSHKQLAKLDTLVKSRFIEMFGDPVTNPMGWEAKKLDSICENLDSRRIPVKSGNRTAGIYPYYGASGIVDYVDDYIFDERLLLVSEDGANLLMRSTPIAFSVSGKIWVNNHAHVLKFNDEALQCFVEQYFAMVDISNLITGSAQPKLNQQKLNDMVLPVPSQERLDDYWAFMQQVDKSKSVLQKLLEKQELLRSALMQEYFG